MSERPRIETQKCTLSGVMREVITIDKVKYLVTKETINVGDLFYNSFIGSVEVYKDVDYDIFDPNIKDNGDSKLIPINDA
jgi:hypothetical protein